MTKDEIQNIYNAYTSGEMGPDERREYESDVRSGQMPIPEGSYIFADDAPKLDQGIIDAYQSDQMTKQEKSELEADVRSGLWKLPDGVNIGGVNQLNLVRFPDIEGGLPTEQNAPEEPSLMDRLKGAGEAALTMATGATGGTVGMVGGTLRGMGKEILSGEFGSPAAADRIEQTALHDTEMLTYAPRTQTGQQYVASVGEAMAPLAAVAPLAGEMAALSSSARATAPVARQLLRENVTQPIARAVDKGLATVKRQEAPTPGTGQSAGSMAVDQALVRQQQASELPVPIKLTKGQSSREFNQQRFERETAKLPEGNAIRQRFADQNEQIQQNLDAFIDATGSETGGTNLRAVGEMVDDVLTSRRDKDKAKVRVLYEKARQTGELDSPVDIQPLANYLNENRAARAENGIMSKVQRQIDVLEVGEGSFEDGSLRLKPMTLNQSEAIRRFINQNTNKADASEMRIAAELKSLIDQSTEGVGGDLYKQARAARVKLAKDYENSVTAKQLLGTKPGSTDRSVALESVVDKIVLSPSTSVDQMMHIRRLLQTKTGGAEGAGARAWKEVQAATLNHIKEQALKSVALDERGNRIVSPAQLERVLTQWDKSGKLDVLFGPRGANQLRLLNDVAKDILTSPPGAVNTSNTATVLAGLLDVAVSGSIGLPAPVATSFKLLKDQVKSKKLKARISEALRESE